MKKPIHLPTFFDSHAFRWAPQEIIKFFFKEKACTDCPTITSII